LESVYEVTLAYALRKRGLGVVRQMPVTLKYEDVCFEEGYRLDLIVDEKVIVEVNSIDEVHPIHKKQLLTYLRLLDKRLGLLINFNEDLIRDGITRIVNQLKE
jgi:GxxExxY protein